MLWMPTCSFQCPHQNQAFPSTGKHRTGHLQPCRYLPTSSYNCHSAGTRPFLWQAQGALKARGPGYGASGAAPGTGQGPTGHPQQLTHLEVPTAHVPAAQVICKQKRDLLSNNKHLLNTYYV